MKDLKTQASSRNSSQVSDDLLKLLSNTAKRQMENKLLYGSHYIDNIYNDEQQHFINDVAKRKGPAPKLLHLRIKK